MFFYLILSIAVAVYVAVYVFAFVLVKSLSSMSRLESEDGTFIFQSPNKTPLLY